MVIVPLETLHHRPDLPGGLGHAALLLLARPAEPPHARQEEVAVLVHDRQLPRVGQPDLVEGDLGDLLAVGQGFAAVVERLAVGGVEEVDVALVGLVADGDGVVADAHGGRVQGLGAHPGPSDGMDLDGSGLRLKKMRRC